MAFQPKYITHLMNSAMMPQPGSYTCWTIDIEIFKDGVQKAHENRKLKSYIEYRETADIIEEITGVPIPVSREKTELTPLDTILVARLKYRVNPANKGREKPRVGDFEFYQIRYTRLGAELGVRILDDSRPEL